MNKYEAMFIINPDISEEQRKNLFNQINDAVFKSKGNILDSSIWAERRKLFFPIKKHHEGMYYLVTFSLPPSGVKDITHAYKLNEDILRVLVSRVG